MNKETKLKTYKIVRSLFLICLVLSVIRSELYCQTGYVIGKVIDSKTSDPVSFASVRLKNSQVGVLTNKEGDFTILNRPGFQSDTLIVSCIGFRRTSLPYSVLKTSGMNILKLVPDIYNLNEVNITARKRRISPEVIVFRALRDIKKNSPLEPFSYISYYRDYQKDKSSNYINLNEAIIETLDKGFSTPSDSNRYRLLDFKKNTDFSRINITPYYEVPATVHSAVSFKKLPHAIVGDQNGNELFVLLVHDAIRNYNKRSFSFVDTLASNFIRNHRFSDPVGIHEGSTLLYKIDFTSKRQITGDSILMKGAIFIEPADYSIHKFEYSGSFLESQKKFREFFNIQIEYDHEQAVNSGMCLKYISFCNSFSIPDTSDNDYFKVDKLEWRHAGGPYAESPFPDMTVITAFNRKLDPELACKIDNYEMRLGKRKAKITKVWVSGLCLYITIKDDKFNKNELDSCNLIYNNIRDIDGNILNKRKDLEFRQFRELFVQEYNKPTELQDDLFIKPLTLEQNKVSISDNSGRYWMNTPLKDEANQ